MESLIDITFEKIYSDLEAFEDVEMYRFEIFNSQMRIFTELSMNPCDFIQIAKVITGKIKEYEFGKELLNAKISNYDICKIKFEQNAMGKISLSASIKCQGAKQFEESSIYALLETPYMLEPAVADNIAKRLIYFYKESIGDKISLLKEQ